MAKPKSSRATLDTGSGELADGDELHEGDELREGDELPEGQELSSGMRAGGFTALSTPRAVKRAVATAGATTLAFSGATGDAVLALARRHLGETYVLGARAPMGNANWDGPWDCAEFVSWCVFQASGVLFGTEPRTDPMLADAFTGFWFEQAQSSGSLIDWREAAGMAGAAVLRRPLGRQIGHIVISDGQGGTIEAHSSARGVIAGRLADRRWDCGILVPGIRYLRSDTPIVVAPAARTLRLTNPLMRGDSVLAIQQRLSELGLKVGEVDGIFGPQTAHAVSAFQASKGLVADGEVGLLTWKALGLGAR